MDTPKKSKCAAVLGTGSDVGKSIVVTALCRIYSDLGVAVTPYKAQNMSNNSFVTLDGGEMGRAQVVQAQAARLEPNVDMNPVLLKPSSNTGAQVVVHGKARGNQSAADYFADTNALFHCALDSLNRLRERHELVVMEGAGSCAEVNLRSRDFVNCRIARAAEAPVLLVADIDRGGVFAQIVGTLEVLPEEDRQLIRGIVINRFRGDADLFTDGIEYIEKRTGLPVLGLIPFFHHIDIDSEDGVPLETVIDPPTGPQPGRINIAVVRLPHISNFTDFDPLARQPGVCLHYLSRPRPLTDYDLILLPGSKNVRSDGDWLRNLDWDRELTNHAARGGRVAGICGGYQILGREIHDPNGVEGPPGTTPGLGLLDVVTTLTTDKMLTRTRGVWIDSNEPVDGYEIHMGVTEPDDGALPVVRVTERNQTPQNDVDGARTDDGRVWGTYLHGLFDEPGFRCTFIRELRPDLADQIETPDAASIAAFRDTQYDLLADHFREHLRLDDLRDIVGI